MCITCGPNRVNAPYCICSEAYYEEGKDCVMCRMECASCDNAETCIVCAGNRVHPEEGCPCPNKHYDIGEAICPPCPDACKNCDLDGNCTECEANRDPVP